MLPSAGQWEWFCKRTAATSRLEAEWEQMNRFPYTPPYLVVSDISSEVTEQWISLRNQSLLFNIQLQTENKGPFLFCRFYPEDMEQISVDFDAVVETRAAAVAFSCHRSM